MIRRQQKEDADRVADIWLCANLEAHGFIRAGYWKDNFETVREQLGQAEVYVYETGEEIQGFVGLNGDYIAGIFVKSGMRSCGIGKCLLDYVKGIRPQLCLNVYQKNERAVRFYRREDFVIQGEGIDEDTGEKEYSMIWRSSRE